MANFQASKVVSALPGTLAADTVYIVRTGAGFDIYVSDNTGSIAHALNQTPSGGGSGLTAPQAHAQNLLGF